ncbi:four helix bundle protein [Candidatus Falkowbacteria bacterium CG10_big_fil_rev_8_21_14_0_10_39_11]|uniref:Four helix bundle protein n=1 Tax=Candidatus Falkowbacteria bacterium CG10_big_fil_rev_8_21_14_0_10_39_11 TaxID=1974565 RepID=A0A2H0V4H2_9BACT|nr:MAG: four helix bundle protein [Candidatus Falkowbacteria bacterium CG10_big_fil_rev_8_21_14_0_10_39_11]
MEGVNFKEILQEKMDELAHEIYRITKSFPQDERYGLTSQIRRAAMSIVLNYIEGYSRFKPNVQINFYEISYGSLKETKYLIKFCYKEELINESDYPLLQNITEEIGAMLWTELKALKNKQSNK